MVNIVRDNRPLLRVVAGVLLNHEGNYLLSSRPEGKPYAGYWEFAGGKVEANEEELVALQREFAEELGIVIHRATPWLTKIHVYEHAHVHLRFFWVAADDWSGELQAKEGQQWSWQRAGDFNVAPMLPANGAILAALAIPRQLVGNLRDGLHGQNAMGAYDVVPYGRAAMPLQAVLYTQVDKPSIGRLSQPHSVWVLVRDAQQFADSQEADVLVWQVYDEVAAQQVLQQLRAGVSVPLVVLTSKDYGEHYQTQWLQWGAHAVVIDEQAEWT